MEQLIDALTKTQHALEAATRARNGAIVAAVDSGMTYYAVCKSLNARGQVITQPTVKAVYERTKAAARGDLARATPKGTTHGDARIVDG